MLNLHPCSAALVAAFLVTPFGVAERAWKPFNPVLGETFEATAGNGVRYLAEQVRRPPASMWVNAVFGWRCFEYKKCRRSASWRRPF